MIVWSRRARADLRGLKNHIAEDSPYHAEQFIERIIATVEKLKSFPRIGRTVPEAEHRDDIRELIHQGYRIINLIRSSDIFIVTVVHGSRDIAGTAMKPWEAPPEP